VTSTSVRKSVAAASLIFLFAAVTPCARAAAESLPAQGFGAATAGGTGRPVVRVTNLRDAGPGSFREALRGGGYRTIVFDVAGEIVLASYLSVAGPFVTIDGLSAPSPGITLRHRGLVIRGSRGAHDVIVRGLRVRDATADGISVSGGAYNILIDRVSVHRSGDGNLDITENSRDVTVSWSIFSSTPKNMLVKYGISRITLHHNLFADSLSRNPQVRIDEYGTNATDTTVDMRNNVVAGWGSYGTLIWTGVWANVANNYYTHGDDAVAVWSARAWVDGNMSGDGARLNRASTEPRPFSAPFVETQDACTAASHVLEVAGVRPLDAVDRAHVSSVALTGCSGPVITSSPVATPAALSFAGTAGSNISTRQTLNIGAVPASPLQWTATAATGDGRSWLTLSQALGTAPSNLTIGVDPRGLPAGTYDAVVTVQRAGDPTRQVSVPVSLTLNAAAPAPTPGGPPSGPPGPPQPPSGPPQPPQPPLPPPSRGTSEVRLSVQGGLNDAYQYVVEGTTRIETSHLKLGQGVMAGFRFDAVPIPPRAVIRSAVLHLYVMKRGPRPVVLRYQGEATADAIPFAKKPFDLSRRRHTSSFVDSVPGVWDEGTFAPSPDLRAVVQEIVASPGWAAGKALTLFVEDAGSPDTRFVGGVNEDQLLNHPAVLVITYDP
jgi:pectate lyase